MRKGEQFHFTESNGMKIPEQREEQFGQGEYWHSQSLPTAPIWRHRWPWRPRSVGNTELRFRV